MHGLQNLPQNMHRSKIAPAACMRTGCTQMGWGGRQNAREEDAQDVGECAWGLFSVFRLLVPANSMVT